MDNTKIVSHNMRGLQNAIKRRQIYLYLKKFKPDICLLQETHCTIKEAHLWQMEWGATILNSFGTPNSGGCAIMFTRN